MSQKKLERTDYDVAWICPVPNVELTPSRLMLDNEHQTPSYDTDYDDNTYIFGEMSGHHVVIATLPKGSSANVNASRVAGPLFRSFPRIRMTLLVGIGGGIPRAPSETPHASISDVHVGDVVVGAPGDGYPGVIYYDFGRSYADGSFEMLGQIDRPDHVLLSALEKLCSDHECRQSKFHEHSQMLHRLGNGPRFAFPGLEHDQLFRPGYLHVGDYGSHCRDCDRAQLVNRPARTEQDAGKMIFHRGRIATGNSVVQDGEKRDRIRQQCMGALCIEMEAAGIDVNRPCLVIRGISDYADSHKSGVWRSYAAAQAAVFARELLCKVSARSRYSTGQMVASRVPEDTPSYSIATETPMTIAVIAGLSTEDQDSIEILKYRGQVLAPLEVHKLFLNWDGSTAASSLLFWGTDHGWLKTCLQLYSHKLARAGHGVLYIDCLKLNPRHSAAAFTSRLIAAIFSRCRIDSTSPSQTAAELQGLGTGAITKLDAGLTDVLVVILYNVDALPLESGTGEQTDDVNSAVLLMKVLVEAVHFKVLLAATGSLLYKQQWTSHMLRMNIGQFTQCQPLQLSGGC